ncbi:MAG: TolC family protein [Chitinophagaceae bacterium]
MNRKVIHRKRCAWPLVLCAFLLPTIIHAQQDTLSQADLPEKWSLENCLSYAKEHNISINTLRLTQKTNEQSLILAKAATLPNLYGSLADDYTHYQKGSSGTTGSLGLSSEMTLYNGGTLKNNVKINKLNIQTAGLDVEAAKNSISISIIQYFTNILMDKETIGYYQDLVTTDSAIVKQMEQKFNVGSAAKKDLIELTAQLASDQYTLTTARNTERTDKLYLKQLLQLPSYIQFEVASDSLVDNPTQDVTPLQDVMDSAMASRPEVRSSQLAIDVAKLNLANAMAGYKPTVTLSGGIGSSYQDYSGGVGRQLGNNFYQQVGVSVSIPIFTRKANKTNEAKAKIALSQAQLDLQSTKMTLSQAVEQAYITTQNNISALNASVEQLKYNTEAYRISKEELRIGSANTVEFVQQKNLYIQAIQSFTNAKYNALLSEKVYLFYRGDNLTIH